MTLPMRGELRNGNLVYVQEVRQEPELTDGKIRIRELPPGHSGLFEFRCPGCGDEHVYRVGIGEPNWEWNASLSSPTFYPSLISGRGSDRVCHFFVTNGHIAFEPDCTHALAGKTVELPPLEQAP